MVSQCNFKICISLIMQEVEHRLIHLLTNCVFPFVSVSPVCLYVVSGSLIHLNSLHNEVIISVTLAINSFPSMLYIFFFFFLMFFNLIFIWSDLSLSCTIYPIPPELGKPVSLLRTAKY